MGSGPSLFSANLFLYYHENKWIIRVRKTDLVGLGPSQTFLDSLMA